MTFVALSRVKSIENLYLKPFSFERFQELECAGNTRSDRLAEEERLNVCDSERKNIINIGLVNDVTVEPVPLQIFDNLVIIPIEEIVPVLGGLNSFNNHGANEESDLDIMDNGSDSFLDGSSDEDVSR